MIKAIKTLKSINERSVEKILLYDFKHVVDVLAKHGIKAGTKMIYKISLTCQV